MLAEGIALGWILIVLGAVLLLIEVVQPGFFITVPATVLIILGILLLLGVDILSSVLGLVIGVVAAIAAALITIWAYGRLTPDRMPTTISRDSLVGKEGMVVRTVDEETIAGKVTIGTSEWSARSVHGTIPVGKRVIVVRSEGVHIVVEEKESI